MFETMMKDDEKENVWKRNLCGSKSSCKEIEFPGAYEAAYAKDSGKTEIAEKFSDGKMNWEGKNWITKRYYKWGSKSVFGDNENLGILGYTDHSENIAIVANAGWFVKWHTEHEIELADCRLCMTLGMINRKNHEYGAILACSIWKVENAENRIVMSAIESWWIYRGGHRCNISCVDSADKTDVRKEKSCKK